jgi:hypothetical protein
VGALALVLSCFALAVAPHADELAARGRALLEEHGNGYRILETVSYRYVLPLDGERYVGEVMTPIEATHDRFFLDAAKLDWGLERPAEKLEIAMFTDEARFRAHVARRGFAPEDGYERTSDRVLLYDLGSDPDFAGKSKKELLALNIAQATRATARQLWYRSGFLRRTHAYPEWLVEGLSIALERDATHESASLFHDGRRPRLATLRAARARDEWLPLEEWIDGGTGERWLADLPRPSVRAAQAWLTVRHWIETRRAALPDYVRALDEGLAPPEARKLALGEIADLEADLNRRLEPTPR